MGFFHMHAGLFEGHLYSFMWQAFYIYWDQNININICFMDFLTLKDHLIWNFGIKPLDCFGLC